MAESGQRQRSGVARVAAGPRSSSEPPDDEAKVAAPPDASFIPVPSFPSRFHLRRVQRIGAPEKRAGSRPRSLLILGIALLLSVGAAYWLRRSPPTPAHDGSSVATKAHPASPQPSAVQPPELIQPPVPASQGVESGDSVTTPATAPSALRTKQRTEPVVRPAPATARPEEQKDAPPEKQSPVEVETGKKWGL
jgi:hypothetical protein